MANGNIAHFGGFKIRAIGVGNLDFEFRDLGNVTSQSLTPLAMQAATDYQPMILANFKSQYGMLKGSTNAIDEDFNISRIIVFVKDLWTDFPK